MSIQKRSGRAATMLAFFGGTLVVGVAGSALPAHAATCNGTGWMSTSTETAYSELVSISEPTCQHKAAAYCNGGWYPASTWRNFGQVSSRLCPNGWQISNHGWYTQF